MPTSGCRIIYFLGCDVVYARHFFRNQNYFLGNHTKIRLNVLSFSPTNPRKFLFANGEMASRINLPTGVL
jgi:hypothetical protein